MNNNYFYNLFKSINEKVNEQATIFKIDNIVFKIVVTLIITIVFIFIINKFASFINDSTNVVYNNCRIISGIPKCTFWNNKNFKGDEGIYLIKSAYDKNIPITNNVSFYLFLNKLNQVSLITENKIIDNYNLENDIKNIDPLLNLTNKVLTLHFTIDNVENKTYLKDLNHNLNIYLRDSKKINYKTQYYNNLRNNFNKLIEKLKSKMGFVSSDINKEIKEYIDVQDKVNGEQLDVPLLGGNQIYNYTSIFFDEIKSLKTKLTQLKNRKTLHNFDMKRIQWIIDSYRDKFIIKSKYNPNISLLFSDSLFKIEKKIGDKKLYERKLDYKNMFKSFKTVYNLVSNLGKTVLNIKDNYDSYYKISSNTKYGEKFLQIDDINNKYISFNNKCSTDKGSVLYEGNNYKLCNPFVLKLECENDNRCKSIVTRIDNPNSCMLTTQENYNDVTSLRECNSNSSFKQDIKKNNLITGDKLTDLVKFDNLSTKSISNWSLIRIDEL